MRRIRAALAGLHRELRGRAPHADRFVGLNRASGELERLRELQHLSFVERVRLRRALTGERDVGPCENVRDRFDRDVRAVLLRDDVHRRRRVRIERLREAFVRRRKVRVHRDVVRVPNGGRKKKRRARRRRVAAAVRKNVVRDRRRARPDVKRFAVSRSVHGGVVAHGGRDAGGTRDVDVRVVRRREVREKKNRDLTRLKLSVRERRVRDVLARAARELGELRRVERGAAAIDGEGHWSRPRVRDERGEARALRGLDEIGIDAEIFAADRALVVDGAVARGHARPVRSTSLIGRTRHHHVALIIEHVVEIRRTVDHLRRLSGIREARVVRESGRVGGRVATHAAVVVESVRGGARDDDERRDDENVLSHSKGVAPSSCDRA